MKSSQESSVKRETIKEKIQRWKTEITSGRHDGWVTDYFKQKIEKLKRNTSK